MTQERKAKLAAFAILAVAVGVIALARGGWRLPGLDLGIGPSASGNTDPTPQDVIYAMLESARQGDVAAYMNAFTGQMETSLRQTLSETTEQGFSRYLRESNASIKGVALTDPQVLTDNEVKVRVEYVFQDRNEAQYMYLEKVRGNWRIARLDAAERIPTLVPYGTPVQP